LLLLTVMMPVVAMPTLILVMNVMMHTLMHYACAYSCDEAAKKTQQHAAATAPSLLFSAVGKREISRSRSRPPYHPASPGPADYHLP